MGMTARKLPLLKSPRSLTLDLLPPGAPPRRPNEPLVYADGTREAWRFCHHTTMGLAM